MKKITPVNLSSIKLDFLFFDQKEAAKLAEKHLEAKWEHSEKMARLNHRIKAFGVAAFSFVFMGMFNIMNNRR